MPPHDETTDDPVPADIRNFYKVELWTRDDRIERMLFAGTSLDKGMRFDGSELRFGRVSSRRELADEQTETLVSIGSGEMAAVYYPAAKAICQTIFRELREQGIWCSPEMTPGSAYNVEHVVSGELEFAIVQSDILFSTYKGIGR